MSHIALVLALFSYVRVSNSDISRIQTYPPQRGKPSSGGRIPPPPPPPLPAVPLPNYVLMTAASTGEFQPDNDLEVTHEFKLHVDAGNEVCLFQKLRQNSRLYFSFKVVAGADKKVDVVIQAADGNIVDQHRWTSMGKTDRFILHPGIYSVCIGNLAARFSGKLVHFFLATYVVDNLRQHSDDLKQFDDEINNVSASVNSISGAVKDMLLQLSWGRQNYGADYYVVKNNNDCVQHWSMILCFMIVLTSTLQIAFVRRLFHCPDHVTKERA